MMEIWNSPRIRIIRKAVLEGRLDKVCNTAFCPYAVNNKEIDLESIETDNENLRRNIDQVKAGKTVMDTGPLYINLSDSGDCNLKCRMCRANDAFYRKSDENTRRLFSEILPSLLPTASYLTLTGNGDPFFRKDTREFMQSQTIAQKYPHLKLQIITNGQLLTGAMWEKVKHNHFEAITVSVDAACAATYEYVRRGGSWKRLTDNLELISALRKQNIIAEFILNFLVIRSNCREIRDFAYMALRLNCDKVIFQKVCGLLDTRENIYFTRDMDSLSSIGTLLHDPIFSDPRINTAEIALCKQYASCSVSLIDRLRTRLIIVLFTFPMRLFYRMRYGFAPLYFFFYKARRLTLRFLLKNKVTQVLAPVSTASE